MSLLNSKVTRRTALVAGGGGALVAATSAVATAGPSAPAAETAGRGHGGRGTTVTVRLADAGFTMPRTIPAGVVTFRITSPETTYHALQGFTLKNGGTLTDIIEALRGGVNDDRELAAAGHRTLLEKATLIGGAVGVEQRVITVTVVLDPGTYYFLDVNDYFLEGLANPRVQTVRVVGRRGRVHLPGFDETILAVPHDMASMGTADHTAEHETFGFDSPRVLPRRGSYLMINASQEIHDIVWRHAKPGTTDEYLLAYYAAVVNGTPLPGPSPWLEPNTHGLQGVSPGRWAVVGIGFDEPGDYALVCYVPSKVTGIPHTLEGMLRMTHLR